MRRKNHVDRPACEAFSCGEEEWQLEVSGFLKRKCWLPDRKRERTILAYVTDPSSDILQAVERTSDLKVVVEPDEAVIDHDFVRESAMRALKEA